MDGLSDIKKRIEIVYNNAKKNFKSGVAYLITEKGVTEGYDSVLKNVSKEFDDYTNNNNHYSILVNPNTKKRKLIAELENHYNTYLKNMQPLSDNYVTNIELELLDVDRMKEYEMYIKAVSEQPTPFATKDVRALMGK